MPKKDPRIDTYIAKSADFARPILEHFRAIVHDVCPDVEETIKWGRPSFDYADSMMCSMVAFKQHCSIGFWKAPLLTLNGQPVGFGASGQLARITSMQDLPSRAALVKLVKQAAKLNVDGVTESVMSGRVKTVRPPARVPEDLTRTLAKHAKARETFDALSPSHRREYVEWIAEAKREETRAARVATAVEWLAEGKPRNWKYMK